MRWSRSALIHILRDHVKVEIVGNNPRIDNRAGWNVSVATLFGTSAASAIFLLIALIAVQFEKFIINLLFHHNFYKLRSVELQLKFGFYLLESRKHLLYFLVSNLFDLTVADAVSVENDLLGQLLISVAISY